MAEAPASIFINYTHADSPFIESLEAICKSRALYIIDEVLKNDS